MNKMPVGWVRVNWEDGLGYKWSSVIPESYLSTFKINVLKKGGMVKKILR